MVYLVGEPKDSETADTGGILSPKRCQKNLHGCFNKNPDTPAALGFLSEWLVPATRPCKVGLKLPLMAVQRTS